MQDMPFVGSGHLGQILKTYVLWYLAISFPWALYVISLRHLSPACWQISPVWAGDGDDLSCVMSRLLCSSEAGHMPSTRAGTVVALADSSRGTGWSAGAGWSIWPEGRDGFPTRWVTSRSSMEIGGIASSWCWQHVTPWYQCPLRCFQGPRICEPTPSYRAAPSRHISVPIPRSDLTSSG